MGKAEQTRALILQAAIELFGEQGYDETGMRDIAERAGTAVGSAYYYFAGKDDIVLALYADCHEQVRGRVPAICKRHRSFRKRYEEHLAGVLRTFAPYHAFMRILARNGIDPQSRISPFGAESQGLRVDALETMAELIHDSDLRGGGVLAPYLPFLFWLLQLGILLYWCFDESRGARRTRRLMGLTLDIVFQLLRLSRLPLASRLMKGALRLITEFGDPSVVQVHLQR